VVCGSLSDGSLSLLAPPYGKNTRSHAELGEDNAHASFASWGLALDVLSARRTSVVRLWSAAASCRATLAM
jgi:hypothetical protein